MTIEEVPNRVDTTQDWLVKYWAEDLGVSPDRLIKAVSTVGPEIQKLRSLSKRLPNRGHDR